MVAYLSQSGAVLGFNGGPISLKVLYATGSLQSLISDGNEVGDFMYDRIYTASAQAPFRVNPFAVEDGDAPDPDPWPPSPISYSLAAWDGYIFAHWDSSRAKSTNFDLEGFDYDSADFRWVTASGYENHPESLTQFLYVDNCTPSTDCDATVSDCCGANLGDVLTHTITGLSPNTTYTATITTLWDERATGFNKQESDTATTKTTLTLGTKNSYDQIYFTTDACPNCNQIGTGILLTNTDPAGGCSGGSSTVYANSTATSIGTLNVGDCLFDVRSGSPCQVCSTPVSEDYAEDGSDYVDLSAGGCVLSPGPQTCGI